MQGIYYVAVGHYAFELLCEQTYCSDLPPVISGQEIVYSTNQLSYLMDLFKVYMYVSKVTLIGIDIQGV